MKNRYRVKTSRGGDFKYSLIGNAIDVARMLVWGDKGTIVVIDMEREVVVAEFHWDLSPSNGGLLP